jgi:GNAT superfamily N-acetyltransferase
VRIEIVPFDPKTASEAEWARFHKYRRLRHEETDPDDPLWSDGTIEELLRQPDPQSDVFRFAVIEADRTDTQVGWLVFDVFRKDAPSYEENKHLAWIELEVLAPCRRQGVGRKLLAKVAELARQHGKSRIVSYCDEDDGKAFIQAIKAQIAQNTRESRLHLDRLDWRMVEKWVEEGPTRSPTSTMHWFKDRIDDAVLEEYCKALTEVFNQMPLDDLDVNDVTFTPETYRKSEARIAAAGASRLTALTREPDGTISGLTEVGYFPTEETMIRQFMTGVRDPYRGRGLGKWLKAAMLLRIREEFPKVKIVVTGNATSNAAMLSINERLGFRVHKEGVMAQSTLESLEAYLNR